MNAVEKCILTINGDSSSIKFALFSASRSLPLTLRGQIARIGMPDSAFSVQGADQISTDAGRVKVRVMRTNEELVIARSVCRILGIVTEKQESK